MPNTSGTRLPEEIIHAIVIRLDDRESGYGGTWPYRPKRPPKHGLASCSLTCRHWAKIVRPILFYSLTLRTAEDLSQLSAFLGAPDFLGCSLGRCILDLDVVEDRSSPGVPWSHRFPLIIHQQLRLSSYVTWTMNGTPADNQVQPTSNPLLFPSALLPRTLPMSTMRLERVSLCNLRLPSARSLISFVKHLHIAQLKLDNIVFPEESLFLRHVPQASSSLRTASHDRHEQFFFSNCIRQLSNLPFWLKLSTLLLTNQRHPPLDDDIEQLVAKHLHLLRSLHQCEDSIPELRVYHTGFSNGEHVSINILHVSESHGCVVTTLKQKYKYSFLHKTGTSGQYDSVLVKRTTGSN
ncbi:uncharacterized protein PHACADRAFT_149800 [Phanerochaete carnosa HHB-10118-sp]|uniref:F-box domain-containing protein n=1 Tax=Phanerochaete carnosa (strain HHB-10118-sp) TaxID=650164 RepID=K5W1A9_PHACS|nr:uncharacterized protein PHACADRAFT_149800 [Phanerochaete carnosa HHB-10118-sp]EKM52875.1 hypothetical protein PHACADRAFT_149800 [Phanerochaete carnosa HHB-10118-sp]